MLSLYLLFVSSVRVRILVGDPLAAPASDKEIVWSNNQYTVLGKAASIGLTALIKDISALQELKESQGVEIRYLFANCLQDTQGIKYKGYPWEGVLSSVRTMRASIARRALESKAA